MNTRLLLSVSCFRNVFQNSSSFMQKYSQMKFSSAVKENIAQENDDVSPITTASSITEEYDSEEAKRISKDILNKINTQIKEKSHSRLFAVVKFCDNQFKITTEDLIAVQSYFPANVGDKIILEKILAIGSTDFTLLGRPLLSKDLVRIEATVIEKTFIVPRPIYRHYKEYRRLHWFRSPFSIIRINSIDFRYSLDELPDVEGLENRVIY